MKIVLAGGSGYLGAVLTDFYKDKTNQIIVLSRGPESTQGNVHTIHWDGKTSGPWTHHLENADLLINLTGKNVNCRYTEKNKREILDSRIDSVRVLGEAVRRLRQPPQLWIQSSSATIYRDSEDKLMDEQTGEIGNGFSENICIQWEKAFAEQSLPGTRKVVLRTGIVLGRSDSALPRLINLVRVGLGGPQGKGTQYSSWIHERDVVSVIEWIRLHPEASGVFNCTAPQPVPNTVLMRELREKLNVPIGLPTPSWLLAIGAAMIGTETELILKSRKVYPQRLLDEGFVFEFPDLKAALGDLCPVEVKRS